MCPLLAPRTGGGGGGAFFLTDELVMAGGGMACARFVWLDIAATYNAAYNVVSQCKLVPDSSTIREFMFCREVGLSLQSTLSLKINTKIIGNMN